MMLISPDQVLKYGLTFLAMRFTRWSNARMVLEFHRHYGSWPLDLADQWHDLKVGNHLSKELQLMRRRSLKRD
jgi:hypothetical protein